MIRHLRLTHVRPEDAQRPATSGLEHALAYMQRHLDEPMTLEQIGEHTGISTATLGRIFRQHLHISPGRHLMQMRMARARDLLRCRDFQIGEVAQACGFRSLSFFSRIFRQEHNASPRQFRESDSVLP